MGHEKEQFEPKGNKALPKAMDMPVNRNKGFLTMPSEKLHWEVTKSLRKEQEGKTELLMMIMMMKMMMMMMRMLMLMLIRMMMLMGDSIGVRSLLCEPFCL